MKKFSVKAALALLSASLFLFSACGEKTPSSVASTSEPASSVGELTTLIVGASPAPHAEILEFAKPLLAEKGIDLQIKNFEDYVLPNIALEDGDIDANYFQHQPYLDSFNEENGTDLVGAVKIHVEAFGIYSDKIKSLDEIKDGAQVAIPNDVTNEARALWLLEAQGLITLPENVGLKATPIDIVENPHNLKFLEIDASQLPNVLPDVDFAVINGNYALGAGIAGSAIALEDATSVGAETYGNVIAVRKDDEERPEIKTLIEVLQSDEVKAFLLEKYEGVVVPLF